MKNKEDKGEKIDIKAGEDKLFRLIVEKAVEPKCSIKISRHGKHPQLYYNFEMKGYNDNHTDNLAQLEIVREYLFKATKKWEKEENSDK